MCVRPSLRPPELVLAVSSKVTVAFSYNLVKIFIMISRRVAYKNHDSMSKVKVTLRGQRSKMFNLCLVRAITS